MTPFPLMRTSYLEAPLDGSTHSYQPAHLRARALEFASQQHLSPLRRHLRRRRSKLEIVGQAVGAVSPFWNARNAPFFPPRV